MRQSNLADFVDQGLGLQIIFLHFSYLVPAKRRYLPKVPPVFTENLSFTIGKTLIFNPVVWVGVWFWVNGTCLLPGPLSYLPGHNFRFFVSSTGPEEIVPESTRGKRRKKKNTKNKKNEKNRTKKKKVGKFDETCPKKF